MIREAPWMAVAFEEGETRWKWGRVKEGDGGITTIRRLALICHPWLVTLIRGVLLL
jgi:hypothetical protein